MIYNCDKCGIEIYIDETIQTNWGGIDCNMGQYVELAKGNKSVMICCQPCIDKMPDAGRFFESGNVFRVPIPEKNN